MSELAAGPNRPELVISAELGLAYDQHTERLYRLDSAGRIRHELALWRLRKDRPEITINTMVIDGRYKVMTHAIFHVMTQRWPQSGHVIDHRDRDRTNNKWLNLREATHAENIRNADRGTRFHGASEGLEQGVQKRRTGYVVSLQQIYYGTYQSKIEANQVARQVRGELYGEFALAPVTWRRTIRGSP
jgi:hypothetical protein